MLTHKQLRTKALARAEVKAEFEKLADEFSLLDEFLKARAAQGLAQAQVAEKIGTTRSAVVRIESGRGKHSPSLATLNQYGDALGCKLELRLVRRPKPARNLTGSPSPTTPKRAAAQLRPKPRAMRLAIISDIHGNLSALRAVVVAAEHQMRVGREKPGSQSR